MMKAIRLNAVLDDDHRLQLAVPDEIPVGPVEVIVLANPDATDRGSQDLGALFDAIDQMPAAPRTREEIDRAIAEERSSWD